MLGRKVSWLKNQQRFAPKISKKSEDIDKLNELENSELVAAPPVDYPETLVENVLKEWNDNDEELTDLEENSVVDCDRPRIPLNTFEIFANGSLLVLVKFLMKLKSSWTACALFQMLSHE